MKKIVLLSVAMALSANAGYVPLASPPLSIVADKGAAVELVPRGEDACDVFVTSDQPLAEVKLTWTCDFAGARVLGDHWERAYGDLAWRDVAEDRAMPWYFLCQAGDRTDGYGVMVQPNAFASWRTDGKLLTLTLDLRAGGLPVELKGRRLKAVTLVSRKGRAGENAFAAGASFCRRMCPTPRLPKEPVYGYNDWYCAYGDQTHDKFLRDLKPVVALAEGLTNRPFAVIDDGWQMNNPVEFNRVHGHRESGCGPWDEAGPHFGGTMAQLFAEVAAMGAKPGLWYRPFKAWDGVPDDERLLQDRDYFDPSLPQLRARVKADTARFAAWGAKLVKIDYLAYDLAGVWPFELEKLDKMIPDGRIWRDRSRTSAEVMKDLYTAMREGAGDDVVLIGCNAVNHLAAGLFEGQRTGNDTSGRRWEQTRKYGVNALGMRACQNGTFFQADPDCAGLVAEGAIAWANNAAWIEAVSLSGQSFFLSWRASLMDDAVRAVLRGAFAAASRPRPNGEPLDWEANPFPATWRFAEGTRTFDWTDRTARAE